MTPASFRMTGKVALVTGSSRGIGRAIAEAFAEAGARVVVSIRDQDACDRVAQAIRARGAEAAAIACNVSRREAIDALVTDAVERLGPPVERPRVLHPKTAGRYTAWVDHRDRRRRGRVTCR